MTHNVYSKKKAIALDEKLTRHREAKPFTHCFQCRNSRYSLHAIHGTQFVCKKPHHMQVVVHPSDSIAGCPYAERHTNKDVLETPITFTPQIKI